MKTKVFIVAAIIALSLIQTSDVISAETSGEIKFFSSDDLRNRDTNPHFKGKHCEVCHISIPEKGMDKQLRFKGDFNKLCSCHDYGTGKYTHPVGIYPSAEKTARISTEFPLENGLLSCSTCHDINLQCRDIHFLPTNRRFLRGGPYTSRTSICFRCHDENKFTKYNPHKQMNASGKIVEKACLYCHKEKPDEEVATRESIELIGNMKMICQRCHNILSRHPAGKDHFVKPTAQILEKMKIAEIIYSIILPLDNEERLTCITCHNPHEKGVIPMERESSKGAGEIYRKRATLICNACHDFFDM